MATYISFRLVVRLITLSLLFAAVASKRHGAKVNHGGRVIGGHKVESAENDPFVVALFVNGYYTASGVILSPTVVLTACHVLTTDHTPGPFWRYIPANEFEVHAGSTDANQQEPTTQVRRASRLEAHPGCTIAVKPDVQNDVGVIILESPLEFTAAVQPAKFFSNDPQSARQELDRLVSERAKCTAMGFGLHGRNSDVKGDLEEVDVKLYPYEICSIGKHYYENLRLVCAIGSEGAPCNGDSGSPLVCDGYVFGVMSNGHCKPDQRTHYVAIDNILEFVNRFN